MRIWTVRSAPPGPRAKDAGRISFGRLSPSPLVPAPCLPAFCPEGCSSSSGYRFSSLALGSVLACMHSVVLFSGREDHGAFRFAGVPFDWARAAFAFSGSSDSFLVRV